MVLPQPCLRHPVTGLVNTGQGTLGGSCDARHRRPNPSGIADQVLSEMTRTRPPSATPGPEIITMESEDGEDGNQNTIDGS